MTSHSQPKEKRGTVSEKRRRQLYLFVAALSQLQLEFPLLRQDIQDDIDGHLRQAERTREADRVDVLRALQEWELTGLLAEELIEETGLSERTVRAVLGELLTMDPPLITFRERQRRDGERGKQPKVFRLA